MAMKARTTFLALLLALLTPALVAAQAVTTETIEAIETFDPMNLIPPNAGKVGSVVNPGTLTCPGGQLTGSPAQPCTGRISARGTEIKSRLVATQPAGDAWLTGWLFITGNADFDANATGRTWGTFRIELDSGGVWEGTWVGKRTKAESEWATNVQGVGRGTSGSVRGMQLRFKETIISSTPVAVAYLGTITAKVSVPPPTSE